MAIGKVNPLIENGKTKLTVGFGALALQLQEAANADLTNSDVAQRLGKAVRDAHQGTGSYAYYQDHLGDSDSGDVYYSCNGTTKSAPYTARDGDEGDATQYDVDLDNAEEVYPRVIYETMGDEDDHYSHMEEAFRAKKVYTDLPLYERFVSKGERSAAAVEDFAGKGKSFPILKPQDVAAAAHAMGRAGPSNYGMSTLKANIISIAKRKGWTKYLPKAWQSGDDSSKESARKVGTLSLVESAVLVEDIPVRESDGNAATIPIKLISPGKGTTAYYTEEVLKRDGPKVFKAGTPMRIDHPTDAQEAERPEGSVRDWGAVLAKDAYWADSYIGKDGKEKGPGLYSEVKPFSDHAQTIREKGPFAGVSICANGKAVMENKKPVMRDGVPVLAELYAAEGVDMVTRAGRGGMFLSEAAKKKKDCPDCGGTGVCATCAGNGKIAKKMATEAARSMTECTDCEGSGDCANCGGDGTIMEAARGAKENEMDEAQLKKLIESAVSAAIAPIKTELEAAKVALKETRATNDPLLRRALKADATVEAMAVLKELGLRDGAKALVIADCVKGDLPLKDGELDMSKFRESLNARAKEVASAFGGDGPAIIGMGTAPATVEVDPKEAEKRAADMKRVRESSIDNLAVIMRGNRKAAEAGIQHKGVAA